MACAWLQLWAESWSACQPLYGNERGRSRGAAGQESGSMFLQSAAVCQLRFSTLQSLDLTSFVSLSLCNVFYVWIVFILQNFLSGTGRLFSKRVSHFSSNDERRREFEAKARIKLSFFDNQKKPRCFFSPLRRCSLTGDTASSPPGQLPDNYPVSTKMTNGLEPEGTSTPS